MHTCFKVFYPLLAYVHFSSTFNPLLLNLQSGDGSTILELLIELVLVHLDFGSNMHFSISSSYTHLKLSFLSSINALSSSNDHSNTIETRMKAMCTPRYANVEQMHQETKMRVNV